MAVVGDLDEFEVVVKDDGVDEGGASVEAVHPSSISTALGSRKAPAPFKTSDRTNTGNDGDGDIVTDRHKKGWRRWAVDGRLTYMDVVDVVGDLVEFEATVLTMALTEVEPASRLFSISFTAETGRRTTSLAAIQFTTDTSSSVLEMATR
ncbi:hypothetical protein RHSIM_Rhsim05G0198000 [Rhododendron simsii]|uniref:Uncharacterized protein n=1 Tax=Rhododendron simsii TaxID=118357 RepID=A0A834LQB4_RHOSS|nr:hypothetical protein RHSIM_Rhsim05G0198000 [Rhododendron simsii]